jgi:hypothetical protein
MKRLEEEAQEYFDNNIFCDGITPFEEDISKRCFIAGANSKWVQAQIIKAKIDGLLLANDNGSGIMYRIQELEEQLNELEDETKI